MCLCALLVMYGVMLYGLRLCVCDCACEAFSCLMYLCVWIVIDGVLLYGLFFVFSVCLLCVLCVYMF